MKKIFTMAVMAVALMMATPANAQFAFGVKGGLNMTKVEMNNGVSDSKNRTGFFIGPTVKLTLPIVGLGIDAAALFNQTEAKWEGESAVKQQSLQIPINLRYGIGIGDMANIFAFAGPQFGFNIGDKDKNYGTSEWKWKTSNLSANIGVGVTLIGHLQGTINYNFALGKTGEFRNSSDYQQAAQVISGAKGKSNSWQIGVAYFF